MAEKQISVLAAPAHYLFSDKTKSEVAWNDQDLAIPWPVKHPIISDRDKSNPRLRDIFPDKFP